MGIRFRRSLKVLPGVRLNIGLRGLSWTVGTRGASVGVGSRGTRLNVGVPGTGLSMSQRLDASSFQSTQATPTNERIAPVANEHDHTLIERMGSPRANRWQLPLMIVGGVLAVSGTLACAGDAASGSWVAIIGMLMFVLGWKMPGAYTLALRERDRRVSALDAIAQPGAFSQAAIDRFWTAKAEANVTDVEAERAVAFMAGAQAILDIETKRAENGGVFAPIPEHRRIVGDDCIFATRAVYDKRGDNDEAGTLYYSRSGFLFTSLGATECKWDKVIAVQSDVFRVAMTRRDRSTPTVFVFQSLADAMVAEHVATAMISAD